MNPQLLKELAAAGGSNGGSAKSWMGTLNGGQSQEGGLSAARDSANNFYVGGQSYGPVLAKYNADGVLQWQKSSGIAGRTYGIATDSSGNVYICGYTNVYGAPRMFVAKFNSSGTPTWARVVYAGSSYSFSWDLSLDSSGNIFVVGDQDASDVVVVKFNNSGTLQWAKYISGTGVASYQSRITVDGSGNACFTVNGVIKMNTSGSIVWQRNLSIPGRSTYPGGIAASSAGNVYSWLYDGTADGVLTKMNSSGSVQWTRKLTPSSGSITAQGLAIDTSESVCVVGSNSSYVGAFLAKYNSSGSMQFQRLFYGPNQSYYTNTLNGVSVTATSMYVVGRTYIPATSDDFYFAALPFDGSKTGSYSVGGVSFTYSSASFTDAAGSGTWSASSLTATDFTPPVYDALVDMNFTSSTLTSNVTII